MIRRWLVTAKAKTLPPQPHMRVSTKPGRTRFVCRVREVIVRMIFDTMKLRLNALRLRPTERPSNNASHSETLKAPFGITAQTSAKCIFSPLARRNQRRS